MMDRCKEALEYARILKLESANVEHIYESEMETFKSDLKYDCIVLRYCIGYLDVKTAAKVLRSLGSMLTQTQNQR